MSDDIRIVPASAADVPLILRFIKELAEYERLADAVEATEAALHAALFGPAPAAEVVAYLARRGMYLEDLFVRLAWRGHGIGRRLLEYLAGLAVARGCGRLEWAVLDWNERAIGFYERLGAQAMNDWTVYRLTGEALRRAGAGAAPDGHPRPVPDGISG